MRNVALGLFACMSVWGAAPAASQERASPPGVTATEIKIGQNSPLSGPVSSMSVTSTAAAAYFRMINESGGINGRRINLITLDDGYSPPRALEQIRRLVEQDKVALIFAPFGTASNMAFQRYLNQRGVPSLFLSSATSRWNDQKTYPWTTAWSPDYSAEATLYAHYIMQTEPGAKIGILKQNDDFGADYVAGFRKALGDKASQIVKEVSFEVAEPTVDAQVGALQQSGANVLMIFGTPKATAQGLRKAAELGWKPKRFITHTSHAVSSVMKPVGFDNVQGVLSAAYQKDPAMPEFRDDPAVKVWSTWMDKYYPSGDRTDFLTVYSYNVAQAFVEVVRRAGDDLSRENIQKVVRNLDFDLPMLLPGVHVRSTPDDPRPIKQMQILQFEGENWKTIGRVETLMQ